MRLFHFLRLLPLLALAACGGEPQLQFRFEEPIRSAETGWDYDYLSALSGALIAQGYEVARIHFHQVEDDLHAVRVSVQREPLSAAQREDLGAYFQGVLAPAEDASDAFRLELHAERIDEAQRAGMRAEDRERIAGLPQVYEGRFELPERIMVVASTWVRPGQSAPSPMREVFCQVQATLREPLPGMVFETPAPDDDEEAPAFDGSLASLRMVGLDLYEDVPAQFRFADATLQRALQDGRLQVRLENSTGYGAGTDTLIFALGSMGRPPMLTQDTILGTQVHDGCARRAGEIGGLLRRFDNRPLARLQAFDFLPAGEGDER